MILDRKFMQLGENKDFPIDYTDWLAENSPADTLSSCSTPVITSLDGSDVANLVVSNLVVSNTAVAPWLSTVAAIAPGKFKVTGRVTTAAGRIDEWEFIMTVKDN